MLNHLVVPFLSFGLELVGNIFFNDILAHISLEIIGLHFEQIHYTFVISFQADRNLHGHGIRRELMQDGIKRINKGSAHAVQLIDETHARNFVIVSLSPNGFRLGLYTRHSIKNNDRAIQHAQRADNFGRKVNVSWGINNVNQILVVLGLGQILRGPKSRNSGGSNSDSALLFLDHPVSRGISFVNVTDSVSYARIIQNALCGSCFTSVNVGDNPDIAVSLNGYNARHS